MNRGNDQIYLLGNLVDVEKVASDVPEFNYDGEKVVFYMQNPEDQGDYAIYVRGFLTVSAMKSSHRFLKRRIRDVKRLRKENQNSSFIIEKLCGERVTFPGTGYTSTSSS